MANALRDWADRFLGRGDAAVTVPPLDGALKPNNRLEEAPTGIAAVEPDDVVAWDDAVAYSSEGQLFKVSPAGIASALHTAAGPITALAASADGKLAMAVDGIGITFLGGTGNAGRESWRNVTAMSFADSKTLVVCVGSTRNALGDWQRDLLEAGRSGEILLLDIETGAVKRIIGQLAFPNGVVVEADGNLVISEGWEKRLVRYSPAGKLLGLVMEDLPGYPARITRTLRGGYWLSIFAPRSQLIEFVLREPAYRKTMMREVDKAFWIAPALRSGASFNEPMQGGALKQMGQLKPWAPTRSYGLAVELTPDFEPVRSLHSRAGGRRHGITAAVESGGSVWLASKGGHEVISIALQKQGS